MKKKDDKMNNHKGKSPKAKERYNPLKRESYWQEFWAKERIYEFNPDARKELFTIDTPPPTVSGALHLGHIYSYVQAEVISRFKRMSGFNVRYPLGLDNNGLPTERLVEKEKGIKGYNTNLPKFAEICLEVTQQYKEIYEKLWKSIGLSVDWRLEYSTISYEVKKLSQTVFKDFYEKGIIYRKKAPALYCPECHTSIAQAEVEDKEQDSVFYDIAFKRSDKGDLIISTTRPELLPACVAVFVNPQDIRYKDLIGQEIETPLGAKVIIRADDKALINKGTGAVMCCTYGDETDVYWTKKYNLPEKIILDEDGKLTKINGIPELQGKSIGDARKIIVEKLKENGTLKKQLEIKHDVGVHERCGTPVEIIPRAQWFVKLLDKKDELLEAGNKIKWHPEFMKKRFEEWVNGLKWDWCISRERFFGIPIPAFSCSQCKKIYIPSENEFPIDPKSLKEKKSCPFCGNGELIPEKDVLDTWFTSSLTPDINNISDLNGKLKGKMYPMSMRPQGHDIIRTWALYSILMGLYRHQEAPWEELMISGHLLMRKGKKISKKSGGEQFKPENLIFKHSADAIRYAMCGASLGRDVFYNESEVNKGKKLVTKIYNAGKFVLANLKDYDIEIVDKKDLEATDLWILNQSQLVASKMAIQLNKYEFGRARQLFEDFFWKEFCDNYLEIVKGRLQINNPELSKKQNSAKYALYHTYLNILKMVSIYTPHIAEEMYHGQSEKEDDTGRLSFISGEDGGFFKTAEGVESVSLLPWPLQKMERISNKENEAGAELMLRIISETRKYKAKNNIKLKDKVSVIMCLTNKKEIIEPFVDDIKFITKAEKLVFKKPERESSSEKLEIEID